MFYGSQFAGQLFRGGLFKGSLFGASGSDPAFTLRMETTGASETLTLPMTGTVAVDIDWDDGSAIETFSTASPSHVYATAGTHDIKITGSCTTFGFNNGGDRLKLLAVLNGGTGFTAGSFSGGFFGCTNLVTADFKGLNTSATTNMFNMFANCSGLTTLDVSGFNTANVTNMFSTFSGCSGLTTLDVSGWNTANVTAMYGVFNGCSSLTTLDVSGWNTAKVTNMAFMFQNCSGLTTLDVSGWNTANVTNMQNMFANCSGLTPLDVSGWNTAKVTNMSAMFLGCTSLTADPGIHAFNVTALTNATGVCSGANAMLSTAEYNTILTNWEAQAVLNNVAAHFGDATHSGAGSTARDELTKLVDDGGHGWTITDGGAA